MLKNRLYYAVKPLIPRRLQIGLRRMIVMFLMRKYRDIWPIDQHASKKPFNWKGWPEGKKFALVLTHDVETKKGHDCCMKLMHMEEELGFRSVFNFVPERYKVSPELRRILEESGFEVGVHGLLHDGKYYGSRATFRERAEKINNYLKEWESVGYRAPSMLHKLDWFHDLNVEYDASTFDTDPFEPQSDGMRTIFPFIVEGKDGSRGYVELPYTLPQDHELFVIMREKTIDIWKRKLDWLAKEGGMALVTIHPDYVNFISTEKSKEEEYPVALYREFLEYIKSRYEGQYWHALPREMARFWRGNAWSSIPVIQRTDLQEPNLSRGHSLNVCMVAYSFYEYDNRVMRYAEALAARGDHVDVIALMRNNSPAVETMNGVTVYRIQKREVNEWGRISYLWRLIAFFIRSSWFLLIKRNIKNYDLVHVHSVPDFEVFAAFSSKLRGAKVILDIHDIVPEFYASKFGVTKESVIFKALRLVERWSTKFADHVIIANHIWEKVITSRSVLPDKCSTYLNYPDSRIFNANLRTRDMDGRIIMMYPGSLNWHQGLDIAIKAFDLIKERTPEAEFHIYGSGPSRDKLELLIAERSLQDKVKLMAPTPIHEIAKTMVNADIGIVPKRNDSFGGDAFSTKIFEFMALGVPVIAANTRIDKYYFNDSLVKFFEAGDEQSLADAMLAMIRSRDLRNQLAANALTYIASQSWDIKRKDYYNLVDKLVEEKP